MPRRSRAMLALVATVALTAAACGSGLSSSSGSNGGSSSAAGALPDCHVDAFKKSATPVTIHIWHSFVGKIGQAVQEITDSYNASQTKVHVELDNQGSNYQELQKNYQTAAANKQVPAIVAGEDTWTQQMIDSGTAIPAQSCINADKDPNANMKDLLPAVKAAYSVGGVQWPAAFGVSTVVLYYNKDHFAKAGITSPPTTLDELKADAVKLAAIHASTGPPLVMKMDPWFVENMVSGAGSTLVDHENGRDGHHADKSTLDNPNTTKALNWLAGMRKDGLLNAVPNASLIDHYVAVATQKSSMLLETSAASTLIDQVTSSSGGLNIGDLFGSDSAAANQYKAFNGFTVKFKVGVAQVPGLTGPGKGQIAGNAWYITKGSPEVESASWDFMKYFNEVKNQVIWTHDGSYLPIRQATQDALTADPAWAPSQRGQWLATAFDSVKTLDPKSPGPLIGPYDKFRDAETTMLETIAVVGDDAGAPGRVSSALSTAVAATNSSLSSYNSSI